MKNLYVVKDGLKSIGCKVDINGEQIKGTNFYLLTFGKGNEGHIDEKSTDNWQLYTQIGELATIRKMYKLGVEDKSRARYLAAPHMYKAGSCWCRFAICTF